MAASKKDGRSDDFAAKGKAGIKRNPASSAGCREKSGQRPRKDKVHTDSEMARFISDQFLSGELSPPLLLRFSYAMIN